MFTNFKWGKKVFYYERGEYFCDFVCVCGVYVSICLRAITSMHFPCRDTICLVSQSD